MSRFLHSRRRAMTSPYQCDIATALPTFGGHCTWLFQSKWRKFFALLRRLRPLFGLAALILSTLLTNIILLWVRDSHEGFGSNAVLAFGNLSLGLLVFLRGVFRSARPHQNIPLLILWSACYCFVYSAFLVWPKLLPLSLLMVGIALAPMLAVVISGDWLRVKASPYHKLLGIAPLLLLLFLASQLIQMRITPQSLLLFLAILSAIVGSQSVARILSKQSPPLWTSVHLSFVNGLVLLVVLSSFTAVRPLLDAYVVRDSIVLGNRNFIDPGLVPLGAREFCRNTLRTMLGFKRADSRMARSPSRRTYPVTCCNADYSGLFSRCNLGQYLASKQSTFACAENLTLDREHTNPRRRHHGRISNQAS
jgi:hypothetical protein